MRLSAPLDGNAPDVGIAHQWWVMNTHEGTSASKSFLLSFAEAIRYELKGHRGQRYRLAARAD
jgi:hypothetical protein